MTNDTERIFPEPQEISEAKHHPNGWVYRISGNYAAHESVPPEAVVGAWKVNENGEIEGNFIPNPNYKAES